MTTVEARSTVRQFARNAGDSSSFSDGEIDRAIAIIGHRFVQKTRCTRTKATMLLVLASNSLPTLPAGFRPEYILRARLSGNYTNQDIAIIGYDDLLEKRAADDRSGATEFIAFDTYSSGEVYPQPDFAYTVTVWFVPVFDAATFNIPDAWLYSVLAYGAVAILRQMEPENQGWGIDLWKKYLEVETAAMGSGNLGGQSYEAEADADGLIPAVGE